MRGSPELPDDDRLRSRTARDRRLRRAMPWMIGSGIGAGAIAAIVTSSGGPGDLGGALDRVTAGWTLLAALAMLTGYLLLALHMRRLTPAPLSLWRAAGADLLLFGLGNLLPGAPAPGALLAARELRHAGLAARQARLVLAFTAWFNIRTLLGLGAVVSLAAFARQHPGLREAGLWWVGAVAVLLLLAATARLAARQHTAERTAQILAHVRIGRLAPPAALNPTSAGAWHADAKRLVGAPANRALLVSLALAAWLADAACLWAALAAAGVRLDTDIVLLAYVAGILASGIPFLPGGIGAVEATIPAVLHSFGANLDQALAGSLHYRGISALLPAIGGAVLLAGTGWFRGGRHRLARRAPG
ncbi:MAG TPA: lysylphosphatidylglycerol synthase domain-containing protein [Solirubrobacteraceae bacterium]|nr:lysylphosphatidylglycerol synthase domain-containing protein [Solirubrobacteraceae bacterium]